MPSLTIVVPAYNEEKRIEGLVKGLGKSGFLVKNAEIIFVLDGKDRTREMVEKGAAGSGLAYRIIRGEKRLGKGGAVWMGFSEAKTEYVGFIDADEPVSMGELAGIAKRCMESGACVIASRDWGKRKGLRKYLSIAFNFIVRALFGIKEKDTQCGCKILPKRLLGEKPFLISGFAFDVELLERVRRNGGRIEEYPVEGGHLEGGKFSVIESPKMLLDLLLLRARGA